jgi:cell division protein FtsN
MKRSLLFIGLITLFALNSCKDGNSIIDFSGKKNKQIERLQKENEALRMKLDQIEESHEEEITDIRSDYEQKLADLQKEIEAGTIAEKDAYYVVVGSFKNKNYADSYAEKIRQMGYEGKIVPGPNNFHLVTSGTYDRLNTAIPNMRVARERVASKSWIYYND